ncbi:MAG: hypothetical protein IH908_15650, partial [Proteobacteria bacterium]|nr:hypothetical protein [Pseudomonadota bacterium]
MERKKHGQRHNDSPGIDRRLQCNRHGALPVMGTFEVIDAKVTAWRDY